jgi:hypothetical protein
VRYREEGMVGSKLARRESGQNMTMHSKLWLENVSDDESNGAFSVIVDSYTTHPTV